MTLDPELLATDELLEQLRRATVGEYDIHSEIARGGMAAVFLAHDLALDRKVAIKVMAPGLVFGLGMAERFKREARTAAALSHPNIVPVYTVREVSGLCFFVMKLIQGTTLDTIIRQLGQAPIPMIEAVLAQAGGALGYAHRNGVIHRDVKPGNILIDDEGWVVVTDFGIAKVAEAEGLTLTGMAVGTPTYMSPEQGIGTEISPASDQYSLGVIGYEMLTGQRPFRGPNTMALMYAHANAAPPPIEALRPDCPERLRVAVMRMLEKEPAARWKSMEEAVKAVGGLGLNTDDPTRSKLVELAKTGSMAKMVARAQTPRSPVPVARQPQQSAATVTTVERRGRRWSMVLAGLAAAAGLVITTYLLSRPAQNPTPVVSSMTPAAVPAPLPPPPEAKAPPSPTSTPAPPRAHAPAPATRLAATKPAESTPTQPPPIETKAPEPRQPVDSAIVLRTVPAAASPTVLAPAPASAPTAIDPRIEVEAVLRRYGEALASGDVARLKRAYPGITAAQQDGLAAFYAAGGRLEPEWTFEDVMVTGDTATARIVGINRVTASRTRATQQPVNLRARLERQSGVWRLTSVAN